VRIEAEVARRGIKLNGTKDRSGPCPLCGGEDRFSINVKKGVWNCRGCGVGGDVIKLVEHLDGVSFLEACEKLAGEPPPKKTNGRDRTAWPHKIVAAQFPYEDENGLVLVVERIEYLNADGTYVFKDGKRKKSFAQKRPDPEQPGNWIWNVKGVRRIPYRLIELHEALASNLTIFIVEGEKCVDALHGLNMAATCNPGGAGKWSDELNVHFRGADVVLIPDNDDAGYGHINAVGAALTGVARRIRVVMLPELPPKGDSVDWIMAGGTAEALWRLVEMAPDWAPPATSAGIPMEAPSGDADAKAAAARAEQQLIDQLASLSPVEYDQRRTDAARELGVRRSTLDDAREARRAALAAERSPPPLFGHWVVEPWPDEVDGDALIRDILRRIRRHVVLTPDQSITIALWILMAWAHSEAAVHSPILLATSAEANSGKTTLIDLIGFLVPRGLNSVGISEAALYRGIELWTPTIIADEFDTLLVENEPLRAVINSGWTRGSGVLRCIGDDKVPHLFPTFCPKVIGLKGRRLPDTTLSRCVMIELKRRKPSEKVEPFKHIDDAGLGDLRRQAMRWTMDHVEALKAATPDMPTGFDNRVGDNWRLMLAVADRAGGEWPEKSRQTAIMIAKVLDAGDMSVGVKLLADIRTIFEEQATDRIASAELVGKLGAMEDRPWSEWKGDKPMTQTALARVLKPFGIFPDTVRTSATKTSKGYQFGHFRDAFDRQGDEARLTRFLA
jgi:putative DNA primase/helicase